MKATLLAARDGAFRAGGIAGPTCLSIVLIAVLALVVGCSDDSEGTEAGVSTTSTITPQTTLSETTTPETTLSETTSTGETSTSVDSTVAPPPSGELVLRSDGLGILAFGEPVDTALSLLTNAVGRQPTGDSTTTGVMPQGFGGTAVRFVEFDGLMLIFSDGAYYRNDGVMHFAGWTLAGTNPSGLATPEGITLGSTVDQLRTAFGDQLRLGPELDECTATWLFAVGPSVLGFEGDLSGPSTDGSSSVIRLSAGAQSEC